MLGFPLGWYFRLDSRRGLGVPPHLFEVARLFLLELAVLEKLQRRVGLALGEAGGHQRGHHRHVAA